MSGLFAPCYVCGTAEKVRRCDSCLMNVCPTHRVVQHPPEMMPQFYCHHCWAYLVGRAGGEDQLYPLVADPDTEEPHERKAGDTVSRRREKR